MGTIKIVEFGNTGASHTRDVSVADLSKQTGFTSDATTSTTVESITLAKNTRIVKVYADELHRVSLVDSACTTAFDFVPGDSTRVSRGDFGVQGGETLYYRLDA